MQQIAAVKVTVGLLVGHGLLPEVSISNWRRRRTIPTEAACNIMRDSEDPLPVPAAGHQSAL